MGGVPHFSRAWLPARSAHHSVVEVFLAAHVLLCDDWAPALLLRIKTLDKTALVMEGRILNSRKAVEFVSFNCDKEWVRGKGWPGSDASRLPAGAPWKPTFPGLRFSAS